MPWFALNMAAFLVNSPLLDALHVTPRSPEVRFPRCEKNTRTRVSAQPEFPRDVSPPSDEPDEVVLFHDAIATRAGAVIPQNGTQPPGCPGCGGCYIFPDEPDSCAGPVGTVVLLEQGNSQMYYHFVAEIVSRAAFVIEQMPEIIGSPETMFVTRNVQGFAKGWLGLLGIAEDRVTTTCKRARTVVWPPSNGCCAVRPRLARSMRSLLHRNLFPDAGTSRRPWRLQPKALVIQRCLTGQRVIFNHDEIVEGLLSIGYEVVVHSDMELPDVREQCRMFYDADLVVGPHGAGLVNTICSRAGTPVLEMWGRSGGNTAFVTLSESLGLNHTVLRAYPPYNFTDRPGGTVNVSAILEVAGRLRPGLPF